MTPHPDPRHLDRRPLGPEHRGARRRVGGQRHRGRGLGREPGEDDGEAVLGEEPLHPGEDGRDGREHGVEGPDDARLLQGPVERGELAALEEDRHDPRDDERHHHGHGHTEDRVDGPEAQPLEQTSPNGAPSNRPRPPTMVATPIRTTSATSVWADRPVHRPGQRRCRAARPGTRPNKSPPKVSTCMAAPSRSPWMPDSATMTSNT